MQADNLLLNIKPGRQSASNNFIGACYVLDKLVRVEGMFLREWLGFDSDLTRICQSSNQQKIQANHIFPQLALAGSSLTSFMCFTYLLQSSRFDHQFDILLKLLMSHVNWE